MKTWYVAVIAFMSGAMLPMASSAASFDCKKASTSVEKLICTDPKLSELDTDLAQAYRGAVKVSPDVKVGQKQWLKERNACVEVACLSNAYQARISELKSLSEASGTNAQAGLGKKVALSQQEAAAAEFFKTAAKCAGFYSSDGPGSRNDCIQMNERPNDINTGLRCYAWFSRKVYDDVMAGKESESLGKYLRANKSLYDREFESGVRDSKRSNIDTSLMCKKYIEKVAGGK